ncbi:flavin reductase family protein [Thalassolituus sp.]|uniref:flavin reductase family protein n=1 Tax=Thalassolituus sp. TaxID=2030822 RepID=UPI002A82E922|nr:flavin reductase family protein [Thalassolituus sp.]
MQFQFSELTPNERYHLMVQSVLPRPIAWILTVNDDGSHNLAPYSFFAPVCANPPTMVVSIGQKQPGEDKDTFRNLQRDGRCVVHIASVDWLDVLNASSATLAKNESEINAGNIPLLADSDGGLPHIDGAPIAYYCRLQQVTDLGPAPQHIVFLEIDKLVVAEGVDYVKDGSTRLSAAAINPLARLGGSEYAALGDIISLARPE